MPGSMGSAGSVAGGGSESCPAAALGSSLKEVLRLDEASPLDDAPPLGEPALLDESLLFDEVLVLGEALLEGPPAGEAVVSSTITFGDPSTSWPLPPQCFVWSV
jgi:hypothetical protein